MLAILLAASALVRAEYFREIEKSPLILQHKWDQSDMHFFDAWAAVIASGDWLTNRALHPYHSGHRAVAEAYFQDHPTGEPVGTSPAAGDADARGRALWDRWNGGKTFHQEPLYPYLLGLTRVVAGPDVRWAFAWQLLAGVCTVLLVHLISRRLFGELVGLVAGMLAVLCGPLLYYELVLVRDSLIVTAGMLVVLLIERSGQDEACWTWGLVGAACGVTVLLRSTNLIYCLGVGLVLLVRRRTSARAALTVSTAFAASVVLAVSPALVRNVRVGAPMFSLASTATITFIDSNAEDYAPETGFHTSRHAAQIMSATDGRLLPAVAATLATHDGAASYLSQLWRKFETVWCWYEVPNNTNFYYYRLHSHMLRVLPVTFAAIGPLGVVGLILARGRRQVAWPLYLLVAMNVVVMLAFYVISRLRLPLLVALIPFAALTIERLVVWSSRGRMVPIALSSTSIAVLAIWMWRAAAAWSTAHPAGGLHRSLYNLV